MNFVEGELVSLVPTNKAVSETSTGFCVCYHPRGENESSCAVALVECGTYKTIPCNSCNSIVGFHIQKLTGSVHASKFRKFLSSHKQVLVPKAFMRADVTPQTFRDAAMPFVGVTTTRRNYRSLRAVLKDISDGGMILKRKKNAEIPDIDDLDRLIHAAMRKKAEGQWMNPVISTCSLKYFGIPDEFFRLGKKMVPNYNQCIMQVDGTDSARTLGMHQDRDHEDKPVNTILACVAAANKTCGKDVIVWTETSLGRMPTWWRLEGLSRESFEFAKYLSFEHKLPVKIVPLRPGEYIYMPKRTWHWACPTRDTTWSVMITSSTY